MSRKVKTNKSPKHISPPLSPTASPVASPKDIRRHSSRRIEGESLFSIEMMRRILKDYQDIFVDPTVEKQLVENVKDFCKKTKKVKIQEQVKNLVTTLEDDVRLLYQNIGEPIPKCPVCLENNVLNPQELKCKHSICTSCFIKLIARCCSSKISIKCPECRAFTHFKVKSEYHNDNNSGSDMSD
jgi:hypothetical protein